MESMNVPGALIAKAETVQGCANSTADGSPWAKIEPSKELAWYPCFTPPFQCARLLVPLDYADPDGQQAAIALVRKPALIPKHSHLYRGPVLFNPGGPGGSGVALILALGNTFSTIIGPQFDIVGFDPRGVGSSTPRASFFDTDVERILFAAGTGPLPSFKKGSVHGVESSWAQARLLGKLAAEHGAGYLEHINTENTATDMLTIAQAHGREKVQYWGFSYGSVLGATFAAMYPDKIERLIIDGVMDSEDYYATGWKTNLVDANDSLNLFFNACAEAGPIRCALHAANPDDIKRNLTKLHESVRREPVTVKTDSFYGVVNYSLLRGVIFSALYSPYRAFQPVADALAQLAAGDGAPLLSLLGAAPYKCSCNPFEHIRDAVRDGQTTLVCNDGDEVPNSLEELEEYYEGLVKVSEWADIWGSVRGSCVGWPKNKKPFRGPFVGNTSHPILVIGNTADPVTPLRSAKKMAAGFKDSVVLTIDSGGHCSINAASVCAQLHVQRYFQFGTLPDPDTVCEPILKNPFFPRPARENFDQVIPDLEGADANFVGAVMELTEKFDSFFQPPHIQRLMV
ncbi:hypothetical protein FA13DRAFT_1788447 [Coprinellus micaceus]|uniref:Alpha/beta-hydrolase n=1 Tax=Coprinellus micaceus TaxID=71717 RepID=A0A4Y7TLI3_COPMI|nr:hypothetical protein FA13DRAFT_1788447 [Coprinellus micaceus]